MTKKTLLKKTPPLAAYDLCDCRTSCNILSLQNIDWSTIFYSCCVPVYLARLRSHLLRRCSATIQKQTYGGVL